MKNVILLLLIAPLGLMAQNITNTLGTNGAYIVEDENNSSLIRASRNPSTRMIFGDFDPTWTLPTGDIDFVHNGGSERLNIVVGRGTAFNAIPKLQFYFTPGPLSAPTAVLNGDVLGIVSFTGYRTSWSSSSAVSLRAEVDGAPSVSNVPGMFTVNTNTSTGDVNAMSFNSQGELRIDPTGADNDLLYDASGNLTVAGAITSQAIKTIAPSPIYLATINDQTLLCSNGGIVDLPVVGAAENGKVITVKNTTGATANDVQVRELTATEIYNGDENASNTDEILLASDGDFVTLQYNHPTTTWYVIAKEIKANPIRVISTALATPLNAAVFEETFVNTSGNALAVNLPSVGAVPVGKEYAFKIGGATGDITITPNGTESIGILPAGSSITIGSGGNVLKYNYIKLQSDGSQWWTVGYNN